mmetsp:Transcript_32985/g.67307  ORF Transcript_32985/g.67307 Transcript_32985/m.67307 type:complete len:86 (-) Transcript_32985:327-584(-)
MRTVRTLALVVYVQIFNWQKLFILQNCAQLAPTHDGFLFKSNQWVVVKTEACIFLESHCSEFQLRLEIPLKTEGLSLSTKPKPSC